MRKMFLTNLIMALLIIAYFSVNTETPAVAKAAGSYYVSPAGSDSNPGTDKRPWKTIQKAAEDAAPGSTVYIKAGTYYERIEIKVSGVSAEQPTVFRNYQKDRVVIDGSKSSPEGQEDLIRISSRSFVRLAGLELVNHIGEEDGNSVTGIGIWGKGEGIEIRDCKIHQIKNTGASGSGAQAVAVYGRDGSEAISGLVIDGNEIWDISCGNGSAVVVSGNVDGFAITRNNVHDIDNDGIALIGGDLLNGEPVCSPAGKNRARNGFVGYNKLERNSRGSNPVYQENDFNAAGIHVNGAADTTIAYNTCVENDIGIMVGSEIPDQAGENILVRDNLIYHSNSSGIRAGGNDMQLGWAADCRFLNNTLYSNDTERQGRGEINILKSRRLTFSSNIIYTGPQNLAVATEQFGEQYTDHITFNHNLYYGPGGSRGLRFTGVGTGLVGLNMWKQKTGQDGASRIADPGFAGAAQGDFRLGQDSPAIDFGDPAYVPKAEERDFAGELRIRGKAVDCGAYEFQ